MLGKPLATTLACVLAACGGASGGGGSAANAPSQAPQAPGAPSPSAQPASGLSVPSGFSISIVANVPAARELAFAPNGDLFAGTGGNNVYIIQNPEGQASNAHVFAQLPDSPAAGVAFSKQNSALYVGTQFGVYRIAYTAGDTTAHSAPTKIASVRPGGGGGHSTTSVATNGNIVYASVGSSCDACNETDSTRATVQQMALDGTGMSARAIHIRNAIALAIDPATGTLWAGDAGQDGLPAGHPFELFDGVTTHAGVADYGWPDCEENRHAYRPGADCSNTVIPAIEFPAYSTVIGAAFYPVNQSGAYAFPSAYRGGAFVTLHGSWHVYNGCNVAPLVAFVPMNGGAPRTPVNWSDSKAQWITFAGGFQPGCGAGTRIGRPTGIAVGPQGDLFVADDLSGSIYRIRP